MNRVGLVALPALLFAGCGGHSDNPTSSTSTSSVPQIASLSSAHFLQVTCQIDGLPGQIHQISFTFSDVGGDVSGGNVIVTLAFSPVGTLGSATRVFPVPSASASLSGNATSGTITVSVCVRFGANTTVTETITLQDASGLSSNALSQTFGRPSNAPEVPRGPSGGAVGPA
jgi:hypothetical protein